MDSNKNELSLDAINRRFKELVAPTYAALDGSTQNYRVFLHAVSTYVLNRISEDLPKKGCFHVESVFQNKMDQEANRMGYRCVIKHCLGIEKKEPAFINADDLRNYLERAIKNIQLRLISSANDRIHDKTKYSGEVEIPISDVISLSEELDQLDNNSVDMLIDVIGFLVTGDRESSLINQNGDGEDKAEFDSIEARVLYCLVLGVRNVVSITCVLESNFPEDKKVSWYVVRRAIDELRQRSNSIFGYVTNAKPGPAKDSFLSTSLSWHHTAIAISAIKHIAKASGIGNMYNVENALKQLCDRESLGAEQRAKFYAFLKRFNLLEININLDSDSEDVKKESLRKIIVPRGLDLVNAIVNELMGIHVVRQ